MYRGPTIQDRFNFMLINRVSELSESRSSLTSLRSTQIHVPDISKWDGRPFTRHSGTYVVPPIPEGKPPFDIIGRQDYYKHVADPCFALYRTVPPVK
jgi:hypothetical protein